MWLLDTSNGKLCYIADPAQENYAILSHVWITGKEQSFQDLQRLHELSTTEALHDRANRLAGRAPRSVFYKASEKIRECCAFARARGYRWLWVDTCCIDKTSSAELSEAINSMYQWYQQSGVCYAFLHDVDDEDDPRAPGSQFRQSRWFRRGWTLQELIAPQELVFIGRQWRPFGTKASLAGVVEEITGIERAILEHRRPLSSVSVARRMAWAAKRKTTRVEDEAYSLMGIFGVNIPTIYGEGRNAFYRLQEEILRHIPDQSIFVWGPLVYDRYRWPCSQFGQSPIADSEFEDPPYRYLFAPSPTAFDHSASISPISLDDFQREIGMEVPVPEYTITSYGIHANLMLVPLWKPEAGIDQAPDVQLEVQQADGTAKQQQVKVHIALLACKDTEDGLMALILRAPLDQGHGQYTTGCRYDAGFVRGASLRCLQDVLNRSQEGSTGPPAPKLSSIYVPYRPFELPVDSYADRHGRRGRRFKLEDGSASDADAQPRTPMFLCPCEVVIEQWSVARLRKAGYVVRLPSNDDNTALQIWGEDPSVQIVLSRGCANSAPVHIVLRPCTVTHTTLIPPPLTALVGFGSPPAEDPRRRIAPITYSLEPMSETCKKIHVPEWPDAAQEYVEPGTGRTGRTVRLSFTSWTDYLDSGNSTGMYSMAIEIREASDRE
ncbi:heterokaryon incompatibility protein-domain-containing protein [Cubamyces lactineus]|nr:heterokaryon incompatibility protein-domain-containing protein [Cubamyces lactineus]